MSGARRNLAVVYEGPKTVAVKDIGYPQFVDPNGRPINHGVIVKCVVTNICGSDLHMYNGRTDYPPGKAFGHEITGEVVELGSAVNRIAVGDLVSVPFNVSCGTCRNCIDQKTSLCLNVNDKQPGGAYGFADMGMWQGGQAEYVLVPYADFCCTVLPKGIAMDYILDVAMLSDILPTGFNAAVQASVTVGSSVYIAGAGPVGICCAASCLLLGASQIVVGDVNPSRLTNIAKLGGGKALKTLDLSKVGESPDDLPAELEKLIGIKQVDCSIDCVGFECSGHGRNVSDNPGEMVINSCISVTRSGGSIGCPGVYLPFDLGAKDKEQKAGYLPLTFGVAFQKGIKFEMGQCPTKIYHHALLQSIINDRIKVSDALNVKVISLDQAPEAYKTFSKGEPCKYVIDPHGMLPKRS